MSAALRKLLIANRGEIALRIARAARESGIVSVAEFSTDDALAASRVPADERHMLDAAGAAAYLDSDALIAAARQHGCDAVHPGYGFLSEQAGFALACANAGLRFVGPTPDQLALFGDKARARAQARSLGVPLLPGTGAATEQQIAGFFAEQRVQAPGCAIVIKAVAGGGGRGMRVVTDPAQVAEAFARCASEARSAFGDGALYAERLIERARHIEIQVAGDGQNVVSLGERECSLQRRFQKLVEVAPSPRLDAALRRRITEAALAMARGCALRNLATFEFLVDDGATDLRFVFIEANPRLQVEHTVTEQVTGIDLVQLQLALAAGRSLASLGLDADHPPAVRGFAIQWRINAETLDATGDARPGAGRLERCDWPGGPGVRVDSHAGAGFAASPHYDSLLAKLIVSHADDSFEAALRRSQRALAECRLEGMDTNLALLRALAGHDDVRRWSVHTRWLEAHAADLLMQYAKNAQPASHAGSAAAIAVAPIADAAAAEPRLPGGAIALRAPTAGRVVALSLAAGDRLHQGSDALVIEAMKMEHAVAAPCAAQVLGVHASVGDFVAAQQLLVTLAPADADARQDAADAAHDVDSIRPDLQRLRERAALTLDAARPDAIARRHATGGRSARDNIADLCDAGSFDEYGALAIAAQTRRRPVDELQRQTPADGMVTGTGTVNAVEFGPERARCVVMAYDYTVLAGTQGHRNHRKTDRLLGLARELSLPVVLFAEGGGGRPGDTDSAVLAGLNVGTFAALAGLSGQVPLLGVVHGRCFAGNAALLGCCDLIVATKHSNIGMGGPAMIEGGGLGVFAPEDIGPSAHQHRNGVIDVLVDDEAQGVAATRKLLACFQGRMSHWQAADQRRLRALVPENRLRIYDMRAVLRELVDTDSLLELRSGFGLGMVTALARIEGRAIGLIANNPQHLGGAIDPEAADKAARFMQLCDARGLAVVSICDTPGFMVGPEVERAAQVRHASRLFVTAAHLSVPLFTVVLRKGYGLGAMAMAAGGFDRPAFTIAWPTGEFGAMGLEGAVRLGYRKELQAAPAGAAREALYTKLVDQQYANGSAINMASALEIDAVIDPADTRGWLVRGLDGASRLQPQSPRRFVDPW